MGEDSTFTVHWELRSLATPFRDVTIAARLPSGVEWTDKTYLNGPYGAISYTAATREVLWRIPRLEANQGTGAVGLLAVFQIRLRPSHADVGDWVELLSESELRATDTSSGMLFETTVKELSTREFSSSGTVVP